MREHTSGEFGVIKSDSSEFNESADRARILVVEDSAVDVDKIVETLQTDNDQVRTTSGCKEGLEMALLNEYELIVISLTLLNEDGLRLCSHIRSNERTRQAPILLLADDGDLQRTAKGLELGANDYLVKPIDRNELLARVRTQIRRRRFQDRLRYNYEQSLSMALTDSLTGLFNRHYLGVHLGRVLARIGETRKPVCAIMFDIDYFKRVNDTYGHAVGDSVLKEVALRVNRNLRNFDMVARFGGEEFVIIMPDASIEAGVMVAERLRLRIAGEPFKIPAPVGEIPITISLGVAATEDPRMLPDALINSADQALYAAKGKGRNCVVAQGLDELPADLLAAASGR